MNGVFSPCASPKSRPVSLNRGTAIGMNGDAQPSRALLVDPIFNAAEMELVEQFGHVEVYGCNRRDVLLFVPAVQCEIA